ncbi:MAG: hypothetical protein C0427_17350 [Rhodobacter sp.]|nr:hypothetical protein [Rhodobacter sp.]
MRAPKWSSTPERNEARGRIAPEDTPSRARSLSSPSSSSSALSAPLLSPPLSSSPSSLSPPLPPPLPLLPPPSSPSPATAGVATARIARRRRRAERVMQAIYRRDADNWLTGAVRRLSDDSWQGWCIPRVGAMEKREDEPMNAKDLKNAGHASMGIALVAAVVGALSLTSVPNAAFASSDDQSSEQQQQQQQ